jgi:serine/threonine-protein kinase
VLERAARPDPESRFTAREFGEALVAIARKVARPTPIDVVGIGFDELLTPLPVTPAPVIDQGDAGEPTGGIVRTVQPEPVVMPSEELTQEIARAKLSRKRASKYVAVAVVLALLGGVGAGYMLLRKESFQVPVLVGLPEGEARNAISNFKWDVVIREGRSDQVKTGEVISSEPGDGVMLKEDQSIVLTVSQGPTFSTLEDFTNVASTDALARIDQLGLVPNVAKVNDEAVAAGTVMSWAVAEQPTA